MQQELDYTPPVVLKENIPPTETAESELEYENILIKHGLEYKRSESFLQVGEINWVQGWILDISVIMTQLTPLFERLVPFLLREKVPFKIVRNPEIALSVLLGRLGYANLAKIISIYPPSDDQALKLAKDLIALTSDFKGPDILTDRHLGSVIYTRFGACKPIIRMNANITENLIYDPQGKLVKEPLSIPFQLPQGVPWPYHVIASPEPPRKATVLRDRYKPLKLLKEDAKGSVRNGLWLQKLYKIRWCVIKEGKRFMISDEVGRDMHDRLKWQFQLQTNLEQYIPLPKAYDFFQENGNSYLVMELIKGTSLDSVFLSTINNRPWESISPKSRMLILNYANQMLGIVENLHKRGYIHRDISPGNFIVTRKRQLKLIDLELTYSIKTQTPLPPFGIGTVGFMSPEQEEFRIPSIDQDIYSIGATLIMMLTGLYTGGFAARNEQILLSQLHFFIGDSTLTNNIVKCLSTHPCKRPSIQVLKPALDEFAQQQIPQTEPYREYLERDEIIAIISHALNGLSTPTFMNSENLWITKTDEEAGFTNPHSKSVSVYKGFDMGLSGILYVLAKAHESGFSLATCMKGYERSVAFLMADTHLQMGEITGGFFDGTAGMALALLNGVKSGLLISEPNIARSIKSCLQNDNTDGCGIAKGLAGKGLILLQSLELPEDASFLKILQNLIDQLLQLQQPDGSWITETAKTKTKVKPTGLGHGAAGIVCFLLEYLKRYKNNEVEKSIVHGLQWLAKHGCEQKGRLFWYAHDKNKKESSGTINGPIGVILCLLKAYEIIGDPVYGHMAKKALKNIPQNNWVNLDLTLATGAAGMGELYLEAARVLKAEQWQTNADMTAQFLLHYFVEQEDRSCYWNTEGIPLVLPGLLFGNCGVIHFLLRYLHPNSMNHPLLII